MYTVVEMMVGNKVHLASVSTFYPVYLSVLSTYLPPVYLPACLFIAHWSSAGFPYCYSNLRLLPLFLFTSSDPAYVKYGGKGRSQ